MARGIATFLMFEGVAEEAMTWYVSLIEGSAIARIDRYEAGEAGAAGSVKKAEFTLGGHRLICIDSYVKHAFTFTPSTSIFVDCGDESELDRLVSELSAGGGGLMPPDNYGFSAKFAWVKDRFGVSWQLNLA